MYRMGRIPIELITSIAMNQVNLLLLADFQSAIAFQIPSQIPKTIIKIINSVLSSMSYFYFFFNLKILLLTF